MIQRLWSVTLVGVVLALLLAATGWAEAPAHPPEGTLTVAVATFGNERWLPHLYVGAEDVVLKPMYENLLNRDPATRALSPMLAERWGGLEGGLARGFARGPGGAVPARQ